MCCCAEEVEKTLNALGVLAKRFKASKVEEAIIAEKNGACAVMALDMIPSRIIKQG